MTKVRPWLEKAIAIEPNAAEPVYALALLKIRQKQYGDVMSLLAKAAALEPDDLGYSYVYAVALNNERTCGPGNRDFATGSRETSRRPPDADRFDRIRTRQSKLALGH